MSRDRRIQQLISRASEGDYDAAESLIFEALRSGRPYWDPDHRIVNEYRASLARFLGYLRWPRWEEFLQVIAPIPCSLPRFSKIGPETVKRIPPDVLSAAVGGAAEFVAPLIGIERDVILEAASLGGQHRLLVGKLRSADEPITSNPEVRAIRGRLHDLRHFVRDEALGADFRNDEYISSIGEALTKAGAKGIREWISSQDMSRYNRLGYLYEATFYLELALAIQCEADEFGNDFPIVRQDGTPYGPYLPYPGRPDRGWRPSRSCSTKGKRAARKAMLGPAIFATSSYLLERLL